MSHKWNVLLAKIFVIFGLALSSGVVQSDERVATVTEYGVYNDDHELLEATKSIKGNRVVRFGFCFEASVNFFDADKYMLVQSLSHPEILEEEDGWPNKGYSVPRKFKVVDGVAQGCVGYKARKPSEAPLGEWVFSITDGRIELLSFTFVLN
ncbi:MAG: DUF3859 domain-containing protein [Betaproteobacteria bacterium]|jgi:hypothetical protein